MSGYSKTDFVENEDKGQRLKILCSTCSGSTTHVVTSSFRKNVNWWDDSGNAMDWYALHQIVQCAGCDEVSFRYESWDSEADFGDEHNGATVRLYPKRDANTIRPQELANVPSNLRRLYGEVIDCFNNESATLCAAGLRALVEGLCAAQGVDDGPVVRNGTPKRDSNLEGKINGLAERRILTEGHANALHGHRFLGNEAVHALARPAEAELRLAIEIVQHMLETLYEIPAKAVELTREREWRAGGKLAVQTLRSLPPPPVTP